MDESSTAKGNEAGINDINEYAKNWESTQLHMPLPIISSMYVNTWIRKNTKFPINKVKKKGGK